MATPPPTAILIVGMHRSGTSALAGLVGKLGVPLGDRLLAAGSDNPKGYWEHQDVVALHERLLSRLGSRWDDVRALPEGWLESEAAQEASLAIGEIISRDFSDNLLWAVKDPRLCRMLPLWVKVLQKRHIRPVVLFIVRDPSEVAASIEARNHWHPLVGKLLWLRYMTEAMKASSSLPREVVLYDDLLVDPISLVTRAFASLGVELGSGVSGSQRKVISDFVDVSDRHHTSLDSESSSASLDAIAKQLFEFLVAIAHGANLWSSAENVVSGFDQEWQNNGACANAIADMAARIERDLRSAEADNFRLNSMLTAQIRWSEEAKAKHEMLQSENAELTSKLTAQIRWSEEAQAKHEVLQAENAGLASKLAAQIHWSEEAQAKHELLQSENAELALKLTAQMQASVRQASELHEATEERDRIAEEFGQTVAARLALATELGSVYASASWRMTKPLRSASRLFKNKIGPANSPTRKPQ